MGQHRNYRDTHTHTCTRPPRTGAATEREQRESGSAPRAVRYAEPVCLCVRRDDRGDSGLRDTGIEHRYTYTADRATRRQIALLPYSDTRPAARAARTAPHTTHVLVVLRSHARTKPRAGPTHTAIAKRRHARRTEQKLRGKADKRRVHLGQGSDSYVRPRETHPPQRGPAGVLSALSSTWPSISPSRRARHVRPPHTCRRCAPAREGVRARVCGATLGL
jgi:hypothetical protein